MAQLQSGLNMSSEQAKKLTSLMKMSQLFVCGYDLQSKNKGSAEKD